MPLPMLTKALSGAALALGGFVMSATPQTIGLSCQPFAAMKSTVAEAGGHLIDLTPEQFQFVRGIFVGSPPTSTELPPGDHAAMGVMDNGGGGLLFIDGSEACDAGAISPSMRQMIVDVGAGNFTHIGTDN